MRIHSIGAAVGMVIYGLSARTVPVLPADMHEWALASIDHVYRQDFSTALEFASKIVHRYPDHPAGYFFRAAALDAWMTLHQSSRKENDFYRDCNLAVEKAEKLCDRGKDDAWVRFFMGGAEGLKGSYEMRNGRYITAFRYGWKGVSILRRLQQQAANMRDIDYGIGSYLYWRSAMARVLKWLPDVADERQRGIALLWSARRDGVYTRLASGSALLEVLFHESRYDTMLTLSEELLRDYPQNLLFQSARGRALYGLGRYEEAEQMFRSVLASAEKAGLESAFQVAMTHCWLAKSYYRLGHFAQCVNEAEKVKRLAGSDELSRLMTDALAEVVELQDAANRQLSGKKTLGN